MKKVSAIIIVILSLLISTSIINAKESEIKVGNITVISPYDLSENYLVKRENDYCYIVDVYSRKTEKILVSYKEQKPNDIQLAGCGQYSYRDITTTFYDYPVEVTVRANCKVYDECNSSGNVTHVIEIISADHYISSSGYFELKNKKTTKINNSLVQCSGTMEIDIDEEDNGEFSLEFLESVGFSITHSSGKVYHLRRAYNHTVEFK